jgi:hypothetical protein
VNREAVPKPFPPDAAISIPYAKLYTFLEHAERSQQKVKGPSRLGYVSKLPPGTELMKRPRTPEEQLGMTMRRDSRQVRMRLRGRFMKRMVHGDVRKLEGESIVVCVTDMEKCFNSGSIEEMSSVRAIAV